MERTIGNSVVYWKTDNPLTNAMPTPQPRNRKKRHLLTNSKNAPFR